MLGSWAPIGILAGASGPQCCVECQRLPVRACVLRVQSALPSQTCAQGPSTLASWARVERGTRGCDHARTANLYCEPWARQGRAPTPPRRHGTARLARVASDASHPALRACLSSHADPFAIASSLRAYIPPLRVTAHAFARHNAVRRAVVATDPLRHIPARPAAPNACSPRPQEL